MHRDVLGQGGAGIQSRVGSWCGIEVPETPAAVVSGVRSVKMDSSCTRRPVLLAFKRGPDTGATCRSSFR